jgi:ParB family transcriptional regulator, chromosome partitioning protein
LKISISKIKVSKRIREDNGDIPGLATNIEKYGLIQPILVRDLGNGKYKLLAGYRRFLAHKHLKKSTIDGRIDQSK